MKHLLGLVVSTAMLFSCFSAAAQQNRPSPPGSSGAAIDGSRVTVYYSRPSLKNPRSGEIRKIWGGLVPYGKIWRLGANEATLLISEKPLVFGDKTIPAGAHSLFLLPQEDGSAQLIVNKQIGQSGTQHDEKLDIARIDMKKETLEKPVEQFTIAIERNPAGGGLLKLSWENAQFSTPFAVQK